MSKHLCALVLASIGAAMGCSSSNATNPDGGSSSGNPPSTDGGDTPSSDGGTTDDGGTGALASSCSTATLLAGNPTYDGDPLARPTSGTGIKADPPLQWQNLVFAGTHLYTRDTGEIWGTDLSAASPVETKLTGANGTNYAYAFGACATARLAKVEGLAALADGSLVAADTLGNGVVHIKDPAGASCTVELLAGNPTPNADVDVNAPLPNTGDADGAGATAAKLAGPGPLVTDTAGNVYVYDKGNRKVKQIGADAAHTVKTIAKLDATGPDTVTNMTRIGNKVYLVGTDGTKAHILGVDIASGAITPIVVGAGDKFPPFDSITFPAIAGITTDGTNLIVSGKGYVWYVTLAGVVTNIAGGELGADYPPAGYDPNASHPAKDVLLPPQSNGSLIGSSDYIAYEKGALYFRGHKQGTAAFLEKIACP